jgi:hypothetical protein
MKSEKKSKDSPVEQAYRAYLRAVKEAWANLDVETLDLRNPAPTPEALKALTIFRLPWIPGMGI